MQLFRKGAEGGAWTLSNPAFSPWHCPPAQGPYLHFRYYSVLESEPQMHKPDCPETLLNIILRWLEFVSNSDCVCLYCSVLWYSTKCSLSLIYLQEEHLGSGSVTPWLQTPTVSVQWFSQASSTSLLQAFRVPTPADTPSTAVSQQEWAAASSRTTSCTIISFGFAFLRHLV